MTTNKVIDLLLHWMSAERLRMETYIEQLKKDDTPIFSNIDGERRDIRQEMIRDWKKKIAEINEILNKCGFIDP